MRGGGERIACEDCCVELSVAVDWVSPPVVHVTYGEGMSSVFLAQVIRPMSELSRSGYDVSPVVLAPIGQFIRPASRKAWSERARSVREYFGLKVDRLPLPPSRAASLWRGDGLFRAWLERHFPAAPLVVIHCRGSAAANMAVRATRGEPRFRVVFDCRGLDGAEYLYVRGFRSESEAPASIAESARMADEAQKLAASTCHAMVCVSEAMKREVVARWHVPEKKIRVVPCCTDVAAGESAIAGRDAARKRFGLEDRFVVAYCGSLEAWQMPEASLATFFAIAALRPDAHFLAITNHAGRMEEVAERCGVGRDRRTVIAVPHTEVPGYLACADVALLIREDSPVNEVASPVKFAEYLSCGLPVILTQGIGDYSMLVEQKGIGCVLPFPGSGDDPNASLARFLERLSGDRDALRRACVSVASERLDWGVGARILGAMYGSIHAGFQSPARGALAPSAARRQDG